MENRDGQHNMQQEKNPMAVDTSSSADDGVERGDEIKKGEGKDESESHVDYNGNSEQNAPVGSK